MIKFDLTKEDRAAVLETVIKKIELFYSDTKRFKVTPNLNIPEIKNYINQLDLQRGNDVQKAIEQVTYGLEKYAVHTPHPKYFGLFNPRSNYAGVMADLMTAAYNPQMAAWSHSPYAAEIEAKVIQAFCQKFGYDTQSSDGVFCTGGAEANLTAVLCALNHKYPHFAKDGIWGLDKKPIIFCSTEAHHSVQKAAKIVGLGYDAVQTIAVQSDLRMDTSLLEDAIVTAIKNDFAPLMVIATTGTTGTGTIDDLATVHAICKRHKIWLHADAAYGGAAILSTQLKSHLKGIGQADSITFDAHKWMSVPMGASILCTSHRNILSKTFRITTEYMPKEAHELTVTDPFTHSIQWSRRFIGLKVYLSLLFYGWEGYEKTIDHQTAMGNLLKKELIKSGWSIKNDTPFPVVCFTDTRFENDIHFIKVILNNILKKGKSWLSVYPVNGISTLRACITNYNTSAVEIMELVGELDEERKGYELSNV